MAIILQTERLTLSELTLSDAPFIVALLNSPGWLKYIGDKGVRSISDAERYILNGPVKSYLENGYGLWLVSLTATSIPIGLCGIIKRDTLPTPDIGYALMPDAYGQGYAHEITLAVYRHAVSVLKIPSLCAIVTPGNTRSVNVLLKLGFTQQPDIVLPGSTDEVLYFIS
ncbi:N-acetyltransferase [Mucilaginibacter terrenus]|uniref:N-acetyltransferase n=1 Tax=Mucilaginibacter terrenus TaxID=2482727 RepID=A0A3E2NJM0_9SPHI|nr:GNAT family N-acetyltransferase [Mucilaginibacter terrenus]RFZ81185.1 N-acetyltransferase [Mucilaginibacter terrenus]